MKYIAFYDLEEYKSENRSVAPAAADVVRYMADVMTDFDDVEIICPARSLNTNGFYKGRKVNVGKGVKLLMPPSFGTRTQLGRVVSVIWIQVWLFFYLLKTTSKNEQIILYHGLSYMNTIRLLKKIKKIRLILEIREFYSDVGGTDEEKKRKEQEFFALADKFVFPTELLNGMINVNKKPYVIATGVYKSCDNEKMHKKSDSIDVVYAGTLSREKGGAEAAILCAEYLASNYHVHILGYGVQEEVKNIEHLINNIAGSSHAKVTYHGVLRGTEFSNFVQTCQIGLASQDIRADFNNTSFPSKILMYLSNGLQVVSGRIPAVEKSGVGDMIYYYDEQEPKKIAEAIMRVNLNDGFSCSEQLSRLDRELREEFKKMTSI